MNIRHISKLFYQIKLVNQEITTKFEKETGFSITRYELIMFLKEHGKSPQSTLQNALKIDSAAVTRHLKVLEDKHYVTRERNKANNREVLVSATAQANEALASCETHYDANSNKIHLPLSQAEEETLLDLLTRLVK